MKLTSVAAVALALAVSTTAAEARNRTFGGTSDYQSNGVFGLGVELGEPSGLNGKLFLNPSQAIDFGIGTLYGSYYGGDSGLHLYADYLWHPKQLVITEAFKLPFYVGVGARFWSFDYNCNNNGKICNGADLFGIRVPLGVTFDLNNVPLDIFVQAVPTLDFYRNYNNRSVYVDVDFSVGIRFWFT